MGYIENYSSNLRYQIYETVSAFINEEMNNQDDYPYSNLGSLSITKDLLMSLAQRIIDRFFSQEDQQKSVKQIPIEGNSVSAEIENVKITFENSMEKLEGQIGEHFETMNSSLVNGLTVKGNDQRNYYVLPPLVAQQQKMYKLVENIQKEVSDILANQKNIIAQQDETILKKDETIQKQHNDILKYQEDVILKSQKGLILEMIDLADQIRYIIKDAESGSDNKSLMKSLNTLCEWVDGVLRDQTVCKFESNDGYTATLDRKTQEVVGTEDTNDPEKNGTYKTVLPGYYWTLPVVGSTTLFDAVSKPEPQRFKFVLRTEQVVKLRYTEPSRPESDMRSNPKESSDKVESFSNNDEYGSYDNSARNESSLNTGDGLNPVSDNKASENFSDETGSCEPPTKTDLDDTTAETATSTSREDISIKGLEQESNEKTKNGFLQEWRDKWHGDN